MPLPRIRWPAIPVVAVVPLAAIGWLVGFLPGLSNHALVFNETAIGRLVGLCIAAGTLGGAAAAVRRDRPAGAIAAATCGVVVTSVIVLLRTGDQEVYEELVVSVLQLVAMLVIVVALALGLLAALGPYWLRGVALAPLAGVVGPYELLVLVLVGVLVLSVARGRRGLLGIISWPFVILLVWLTQTGTTAATAVGPMLRPGFGVAQQPRVAVREFLAYTRDIFGTVSAHHPVALACSVLIALAVVGARILLPVATDPTTAADVAGETPPTRTLPTLVPQVLLTCVAVVLVAAAVINWLQAYFCLGPDCPQPAPHANVVAYRVIGVLMALTTIGALAFALVRRSVGGVITQLLVIGVVAAAAALLAVPAIGWQQRAPEPYRSDPSHPGAPPCYSGSGDCEGG